jgi:hypothetical protein
MSRQLQEFPVARAEVNDHFGFNGRRTFANVSTEGSRFDISRPLGCGQRVVSARICIYFICMFLPSISHYEAWNFRSCSFAINLEPNNVPLIYECSALRASGPVRRSIRTYVRMAFLKELHHRLLPGKKWKLVLGQNSVSILVSGDIIC